MADEPTTVKIPASWAKVAGGIIAAVLAGGGGGSLLTSEKSIRQEMKIEELERRANDHHRWLLEHNDELRKLEAKP